MIDEFFWDDHGSSIVSGLKVKIALKDLHLRNSVVLAECTMQVNVFDTICETQERGSVVFGINEHIATV